MKYKIINEYKAITQQGMKCVEHELCNGPKTTEQLQNALEDNNLGSSVRTVQELIKKLNEVYGGDNYISRTNQSKQHEIKYCNFNLAFPELFVNDNDREVVNKILKLTLFFDGLIPMKEILEISKLMNDDFCNILDEIRENADININTDEASLIAKLYYAIDQKKVIMFKYKPLGNIYYGKEICVSPYYLKNNNNKWFLIGHVENLPQKDVGHNYPWSVFPLQRILSEGGTFFKLGMSSSKQYKEIDRKRIKEYYKHVIGFYVPVEKEGPFIEQLNPVRIIIQAKDDKTFKYIKENKIHSSQFNDVKSKRFIISVIESPSLYSKLLSYGGSIEVIEPENIRMELYKRLQDAVRIYK